MPIFLNIHIRAKHYCHLSLHAPELTPVQVNLIFWNETRLINFLTLDSYMGFSKINIISQVPLGFTLLLPFLIVFNRNKWTLIWLNILFSKDDTGITWRPTVPPNTSRSAKYPLRTTKHNQQDNIHILHHQSPSLIITQNGKTPNSFYLNTAAI